MPLRCALPLVICAGICCAFFVGAVSGQSNAANAGVASKQQNQTDKKATAKPAAKPLSQRDELQKAISDAGNDRAALVQNLKAFLEKFPESTERPQIYRALVEACIQFKDDVCAM